MIVPALGHMKLKDIKPIHVQRFVNDLTACKAITQKKKPSKRNKNAPKKETPERTLSPATVQRYYTCLRSVIHSAYRLELISSNPCDKSKITLPSIGEQKTEIYDKQELAQLLEALKDEPLQFQVLIHLAIIMGCRRGELVALEWSDIDFDTGVLTVSKSAYQIKGEPTKIKDTKTHKSRKVALPDYCLNMLHALEIEQFDRRLNLGSAWNGENWVFTQADGSIMFPTRMYNLSDDQAEYQINDRRSFMRFLGLEICDTVPDAKTIWKVRNDLTQANVMVDLFYLFDSVLKEEGFITHTGTIIDATFVDVPRQRNSREENQRWRGTARVENP